jgi:hypothetical protein
MSYNNIEINDARNKFFAVNKKENRPNTKKKKNCHYSTSQTTSFVDRLSKSIIETFQSLINARQEIKENRKNQSNNDKRVSTIDFLSDNRANMRRRCSTTTNTKQHQTMIQTIDIDTK